MKSRNKTPYKVGLWAFVSNMLFMAQSKIAYASTFKFSFDSNGMIKITGSSKESSITAWQEFLSKYRNLVILLAAIAALTMVVLFIIGFIRLGASAGNPNARSEAIKGIIVTGIATALLGSVSLITYLSYSALGPINNSEEKKDSGNHSKVEIQTSEDSYANLVEKEGVLIYEKLSSAT